LPTNPLSPSKSESVVSSLITSKLPTGPLFAQLAEPTWTWSVVPYWADILQFSALDGRQYSASAYKAGVEQVRPAFPLPPDEGRVTIYAASYFQGTVGDDGVTLQLNGETFSGIPSGAPVLDNGGGVTRTDTITREDGSSVSKQWHLYPIADGSGSGFAPGPYTAVQRYLTVIPSQAGVGFRNVGASGVNTTLQFDLVTQGTPQPTLNTWTVAVVQSNNTTNQPFHVFSPTSDSRGPGIVSTLSNGVHVDLPWDRKNSSGNVIEGDFTWVLAANATLPGGTAGAAANTTYKLDQQTEKGIRISDPPTANDFDPTAGENTTLKFDVTTTGITEPTINWNVTVLDSANTTYYQEQGTSNDGSTSIHVTTTPWLGNNTSGNIISGPFTWVIAANTTATVASTEGAGGAETATPVAYESAATLPELLISEDPGSGLDPQPKVFVKGFKQGEDSLKTILRNDQNWIIKGGQLSFTDKAHPPALIKATVRSLVSNVTQSADLSWNEATKSFSGNFHLNPALFSPTVSSSESYKVVQKASAPNDHPENTLEAANYLVDILFKNKTLGFGRLLESLNIPGSPDLKKPDLCPSEYNNFTMYGFEGIEVTLDDAVVNATSKLSAASRQKALVKLQHPAENLVVDLHGNHSGMVFVTKLYPGIARLLPSGPDFVVSPVTKKFVCLSCEALDLRDYNNYFSSLHFDPNSPAVASHPPGAGQSARQSFGGEKWFNAFNGVGPKVSMLGYAGPAPLSVRKELLDLYKSNLTSSPSDIIAWLRANREIAKTFAGNDQLGWLCLNACAYDTNGDYYYLAYETPAGNYQKLPPAMAPGTVPALGIYKVPRGNWNLEAVNWNAIPQKSPSGSIGQFVE
jgi:hypothetical protein